MKTWKVAVSGKDATLYSLYHYTNLPTMPNKQVFPNNLRVLRIQAGLRQCDVAQALGFVRTDRISHWEKGVAVPHLVNLFKLAVLYNVAPQVLYAELFAQIEWEKQSRR